MDASYNPFSGWSRVGQGWDSATSTLGALPYPSSQPPANLITFYITSFNPDIFNCIVIGPNQQSYLRVVTDPQNPAYTLFQNAQKRSVALVEWQSQPLVEIRDVTSKGRVKDWLRLSSDKRARVMKHQGAQYNWTPNDRYIDLYTSGSNPVFLARVSRGHGTITLDLTSQAYQLGLLDSCIISTVLMQCGRNID